MDSYGLPCNPTRIFLIGLLRNLSKTHKVRLVAELLSIPADCELNPSFYNSDLRRSTQTKAKTRNLSNKNSKFRFSKIFWGQIEKKIRSKEIY